MFAVLTITAVVLLRYFAIALPFWFLFYQRTILRNSPRQIYNPLPGSKQQWSEIRWSLLTSVLFGVCGVGLGWMWQRDWSLIYLRFDDYGYWYLPVSFVVIALIHDFYFYVTHRWLHIPSVYRRFHTVHHQSITPSPWASFSFHPVESFIQAMALPLIVLLVPVHPVVLLIYLTVMTLSAINNHLGFELLPRANWGHWLISAVHHSQHHRYFRYNYGLFFAHCDRIFKTEHPQLNTNLETACD